MSEAVPCAAWPVLAGLELPWACFRLIGSSSGVFRYDRQDRRGAPSFSDLFFLHYRCTPGTLMGVLCGFCVAGSSLLDRCRSCAPAGPRQSGSTAYLHDPLWNPPMLRFAPLCLAALTLGLIARPVSAQDPI